MMRRLVRLAVRSPGATLAVLIAASVWSAVAVNALALQGGPHPAPLLGKVDLLGKHPVVPNGRSNYADQSAAIENEERVRAAQEERALVRELQELLAERGFYSGEVDGLAGPMTQEAIAAFEALAGLDVTGQPRVALLAHIQLSSHLGPGAAHTEARHRSDEPSGVPEANDPEQVGLPGMSTLTESDLTLEPPELQQEAAAADGDPRVEAVQRVLADLGYAPGRIDGQLGPQTADAIKRFQQDRGLAPTGELDHELLRELSAVSGIQLG